MIQLRAWLNNIKKMVQVHSIELTDGTHDKFWYGDEGELWDYVDYRNILPYIGIKDNTDRQLYKGDIFVTDNCWNCSRRYKEEFRDKYVVEFEHGSFYGKCPNGLLDYIFKECSYKEIKIIGNIYENPELLEK